MKNKKTYFSRRHHAWQPLIINIWHYKTPDSCKTPYIGYKVKFNTK